MEMRSILAKLMDGRELKHDECAHVMNSFVSGETPEPMIAALLIALQIKGATGSELAAFASSLSGHCESISLNEPALVDTCGTGGGIPSFNISTAAAFIAAGAGVKVAKHGNRAVTSSCGSADVLEALGARLDLNDEEQAEAMRRAGICFLFAPRHHPALKHVGPVRRALGVRTVFNVLGPLLNPAGVDRQVVGVNDPSLTAPVGFALSKLGRRRALVVHGLDGLDEVSPCGDTAAAVLEDGELRMEVLQLSQFGLSAIPAEALRPGESVLESAEILREAVCDPESPRCRAALPAAAAALWAEGSFGNLANCAGAALEAVRGGSSQRCLETWLEVCTG